MHVSPGVVFAEVDGDTVLLDGESGVYYGLNPTGTRVWPLIVNGAAVGEIFDTLLAEYDVSDEVLWHDLMRLLGDMQEHGLVALRPPQSDR